MDLGRVNKCPFVFRSINELRHSLLPRFGLDAAVLGWARSTFDGVFWEAGRGDVAVSRLLIRSELTACGSALLLRRGAATLSTCTRFSATLLSSERRNNKGRAWQSVNGEAG